jgi:hypothetical protein
MIRTAGVMKTCIVRAVCSGNIQRSPTFQAIFSYFYSASDMLPFPIVFDSAGIDVDKILTNSTPATKKLDIIDAGRYYNVINGENKRLADELLNRWHGKAEAEIPDSEKARITLLYSGIKTDVHTVQKKVRNEALLEAGIPERFLPGMRIRFRHDAKVKLLLPVDDSIVRKIEDYYRLTGDEIPVMQIYGYLAGVNMLNDELTGGMETARKQVKYFMGTRDKTMDEIIRLLSKDTRR